MREEAVSLFLVLPFIYLGNNHIVKAGPIPSFHDVHQHQSEQRTLGRVRFLSGNDIRLPDKLPDKLPDLLAGLFSVPIHYCNSDRGSPLQSVTFAVCLTTKRVLIRHKFKLYLFCFATDMFYELEQPIENLDFHFLVFSCARCSSSQRTGEMLF